MGAACSAPSHVPKTYLAAETSAALGGAEHFQDERYCVRDSAILVPKATAQCPNTSLTPCLSSRVKTSKSLSVQDHKARPS